MPLMYHGGGMPQALKNARTYTCTGCGGEFQTFDRDRVRCVDCGIGVFIDNVKAQRARSGPTYEKTVVGQLRYWHAEAERLGLPIIGIIAGAR